MDKFNALVVVEDAEENKKYYRNKYQEYLCYCRGEKVGMICWREEPGMWEHKYEARVFVDDEHTDHVAWAETFIAAKASLKKYIEKRTDEVYHAKRAPAASLPAADMEFYPTPPSVAGELFAGVNWRNVRSILEPSAGKGDLLDYAKQVKLGKNYQGWQTRLRDRELDIDCVELDENLRHILTGKGYRVVHDDFLTFSTRKRYDLVLMNPPFSNGDLHLLHALELCENGGQIACILNAETLRNTYTKSRITLMKKLNEHHASIRYLSKAFKDAERKADVDVALINVTIPAAAEDTSIYDALKKAADHEDADIVIEKDVALANPVDRLIREYDLLCATGIELMKKYNGVARYIMTGSDKYDKPIIRLSIGGHEVDCRCDNSEINNFLKIVRRRYWRELFNIPNLREKMTSKLRDEYDSMVNDMQDYEFSMFNVQQVLDQIKARLSEGAEDAIMKCFEKLSNEHAYHKDIENENIHYFNGWKTNKAHYVNSRCIIPTWGCFAREYKPDKRGNYRDVYENISPSGCFKVLDDLEKALDYLDKGETEGFNLRYTLEDAAKRGRSAKIPCKYFNVTFYKKGTCHIQFTEQKILDRLNIFAGRKKMWLPPTYGKVKYSDMDDESKRVVDEFLGKEHYETVMQKPSDYVIEGAVIPLLEEAM